MTAGTEVTAEMATQPHVVILPFPAKGHSIPVLHFARQLSALGVTITFVNAFDHIEPKDFKQVEGLDKLRVVGLGGLPQPGDEIGPLPMIPASERITQDFEDLLQELRSTPGLAPPVCILCDMFLGWTQVCMCDTSQKMSAPNSTPDTLSATFDCIFRTKRFSLFNPRFKHFSGA